MDVPVSESNKAADVERTASAPQRKRRLGNLLNSPILLVVMVLATIGLALKWYSLQASLRAPDLPSWNWSAHPNTLLIYYPHTDCGCGPGLSAALGQANAKHFDIAIISDVQGENLSHLNEVAIHSHAFLLSSIGSSQLKKWCPTGNTTMLCIKNGYIIRKLYGTNIPTEFL